MKVCLIDADSKIPNLALMKLSAYHKSIGDSVDLFKAKLPYYPNKIKKEFQVPIGYDKYYCSVIFKGNKEYIVQNIECKPIEFGGTGYSLEKTLPDYIEEHDPDYSIYPENNMSYGFISRGCIRNCSFCFVPKKEGYIKQVSEIDKIIKHKKVKFLDNNILALPNHKDILQELINKRIKCQFNQGLDIRLLDQENSMLLSKLNYIGKYIFAFDNIKYKDLIIEKLNILSWRKDWQIKFYVYVNPEMSLKNTIKRIKLLKELKCLPYIMRDITCWKSKHKDFYTDITSYCNQPAFFITLSFEEFLYKRHSNYDRINKSLKSWEEV